MKKITSETEISFAYDSVNKLQISSEAIFVRDDVAKVLEERLGSQIVIEDAGPDGGVDSDEAAEGGKDEGDSGPSHADLKARAKELGLKQSGTKAEIAERIAEEEKRLADAKVDEPTEVEQPAVVDDGVETSEVSE